VNRSHVNRALALGTVVLSLLALTGCGTTSQQYATDKADGVYFSVPRNWLQIPKVAIDSVESKSISPGAADRLAEVHWQVAYTLDKELKASQVLSLTAPTKPVVYVRVRSLNSDEMNAVSYNTLRDLVVPLTSWASGSDSSAPTLSIQSDSEIVQRGGRGVQTRFTFTPSNGQSQTIDQSAVVSDDRSTIYIMIARCTASCFSAHEKEFSQIIKSFTVRGQQ
jgi:hypothetical protein